MSKIGKASASVTAAAAAAAAATSDGVIDRGKELADQIVVAVEQYQIDNFGGINLLDKSLQQIVPIVEQVLESKSSAGKFDSNLDLVIAHVDRSPMKDSFGNDLKSLLLSSFHSIRRKREGEAYLNDCLKARSTRTLSVLKPGERWRLFIDGTQQAWNNSYQFDDEAGYYGAMCFGFGYVVETLGRTIDAKSYEELHAICVEQVFKTEHRCASRADVEMPPASKCLGQKYRDNTAVHFGLIMNEPQGSNATATREGIQLLEAKCAFEKNEWATLKAEQFDASGRILSYDYTCHPQPKEKCQQRVDQIFTRYYTDIKQARKEHPRVSYPERKKVILDCCQALTQAHPFGDGNIRTITLVMNKFLLENGLSPAMLTNPNCLDAFHMAALDVELEKGQDRFFKFCDLPPLPPRDDRVPKEAARV